MSVIAISGGIGGAKLCLGLKHALNDEELVVITNPGDDFEHLGMTICPDLDTVMYTLAGCVNTETGWGRADETWNFMKALKSLGGEDWFALGDLDLALHVERTRRLSEGESLTQIAEDVSLRLAVGARVLPATDQCVRTIVNTPDGSLSFQQYFVALRAQPAVTGFEFQGVGDARPSDAVLSAFKDPELRGIIICPSNPYISIDPMLAIPGFVQAIRSSGVPVVAVSPVVAGAAIKGPTVKMMRELNIQVSALSVAEHYAGLIDGFLLDERDAQLVGEFQLPIELAQSVMRTLSDRIQLAEHTLRFARALKN